MSIVDVAAIVETQMRSEEPALTPPFEFGADKLSVDRAKPTIILVPYGPEAITGPQGQGGDGVSNPRPLFTRNVSIAAHIWGCDVPQVELMQTAFVQAMQATIWGSYRLSGGQWHTASDMVTKWGVVYTLNLTWLVPITRAPDTYALVTAMPITPAIVTS